MWFDRDADEAYRFVSGLGFVPFMLEAIDEAGKERALTDLRATIDAHATDDGVLYPSAAWVITARRP